MVKGLGCYFQKTQVEGPYKNSFPILCRISKLGSDDSEKGPAGVSGDLILLRTPVSASYDLVIVDVDVVNQETLLPIWQRWLSITVHSV